MNALFLSASVPKPGRAGSETSEPFLIREAVSALVEVAMGRIPIIWGGHPAITPMLWEAAERYGISYQNTTKLYQSAFFKDSYPSENVKFDNWVEIAAEDGREQSLLALRKRMLTDHMITHAVFIGGMEGIFSELDLVNELAPKARKISIPSAGGVSKIIFEEDRTDSPKEMSEAIDYTYWMYKLLDVNPASPRHRNLF